MSIKKSAAIITTTTLSSLAFASEVFAQSPPPPSSGPLDINFSGRVKQGVDPNASPATLISSALNIVFIVGTLAVLFFMVIGAFNWITSGGDKEKVGKARGTIVNALIGLAILALAFFITRVVGQILGINVFDQGTIPTLPRTP